MKLTMRLPSVAHPTGGYMVFYEMANAMAAQGHEVHIVHMQHEALGNLITDLSDLRWFNFHDGVNNHVEAQPTASVTGDVEWHSDVLIGTPGPAWTGLPVTIIQGYEMFTPELDLAAFRAPGPKIVVASWLVDVARRFGVPDDQVTVINPGINHEIFRPMVPLEQRGPVITALRHPHRAKGWDVAVEVMTEVQRRRSHVRAVVFGTSPVGPSAVPPWMTVVDSPSQRVLAEEVFNRSAVILQASRHEGFGMTAVEAMACGCALVTTENGGSRDYAVSGVGARTVLPGDVDGLADHVVDLLDDDEERIRMAEAGRREVARLRWDRAGRIFEGLLEAYVSEPERYQEPPSDLAGDQGPPSPISASTILAETRSELMVTGPLG